MKTILLVCAAAFLVGCGAKTEINTGEPDLATVVGHDDGAVTIPESSIRGSYRGLPVAGDGIASQHESSSDLYIKIQSPALNGEGDVMAVIRISKRMFIEPGTTLAYDDISDDAGFSVNGCEGPGYDLWLYDTQADEASISVDQNGVGYVVLNYDADFGVDGHLAGHYLVSMID